MSPGATFDHYYKLSRRFRLYPPLSYLQGYEMGGSHQIYGDLWILPIACPSPKDLKLSPQQSWPRKQSGYPKCLLCRENMRGYAGRVAEPSPARQNHRIIIPVTINDQWGFNYSPYVYYNEHCIVFNSACA